MTDALKKRISALREMTVGRGCTEAEALSAAAKAADLMREHGIRQSDLAFDQKSVSRKTEGQSPRDALWRRIAYCTNTASIMTVDENRRAVRAYVGREPGPEIATYLYIVLDRAIDRAIADFKAGEYYRRRRNLKTRRAAVAEFTQTMVRKLEIRLIGLFQASISPEATAAANAVLEERFPHSVTVTPRTQATGKVTAASIEGYLAGEAVTLSHGVSGAGVAGLIGGGQ
ncbi:DUF2786 domain-containing protein [Rhizobium cremeum]|uniref:DUF7168 domain-containing protein n=1 Tax=Rhizobium cremeum TaxID=2813827 RepID=UPI001FD50892|nr:DUF2786 domain-containing protein [Rhizobium cremeum]MCJ7996084.1 DUF2786 domain-containing protein [Rhizobium cremeum]MCJ8001343.1 DUF2786 domain-containing protein [Rhizobium cremeum]